MIERAIHRARRARPASWAWVALAILTGACAGQPAAEVPPPSDTADRVERSTPSAGPVQAEARPRVVVLGDSLTAGYGIDPSEAFPAELQDRIDAAGLDYTVVNMGVSGDTSAGGLRRLDWALEGDVRVLIVALGGNDGLRGLSPQEMERNLGAIVDAARSRGIDVLLCGMEAPPNFGPAYTSAFRAAFRRVAEEKDVPLIPFLLEGVAGIPALNQADGIHPTPEGARRIADLVWTRLAPMLDAPGTR
jgi:acyl-CoA thioesterase-1